MAWSVDGNIYERRLRLAIDYTKIDAALSNFPVTVFLNSARLPFNYTTSNGYDVRFTQSDGTTLLKFERERHNKSSQLAEYHVKIPSVSNTASTLFYMYFRPTSASNGADAVNVWDSNYKGVWHLSEDPSGGAPQMQDSTSNNNDGTSAGSMTSGDLVSGKIYNGLEFDGSDDRINVDGLIGEISSSTTGTIELWVKYNSDPGTQDFVFCISRNASSTLTELVVQFDMRSGNRFAAVTGFRDGTLLWLARTAIQGITAGNWYNLGVSHNGSESTLYLNGVADTTFTVTTDKTVWFKGVLTDASSDADAINLGLARRNGANVAPFHGILDEVRTSGIARSAAWVKASYHSQNDTLLIYNFEASHLSATMNALNF